MPILKATDVRPKRPVVFGIHGEPGLGKTSLAFTAHHPLLLDFDRGSDRAGVSGDVLYIDPKKGWQEAVELLDSDDITGYDTIIIDTAKAALDSFLAEHVMRADYKNRRGNVLSMQGYGALGAEFKVWLNRLRNLEKDVVYICHSKDEKENDTLVKYPAVTGGSYDLLMQCSDQLGYIRSVNGKRTINFTIHDSYKSKDTAGLGAVEIPNLTSPLFVGFLGSLIEQVKTNIADRASKAGNRAETWKSIQAKVSQANEQTLTTIMFEIAQDVALSDSDKQFARNFIGQKAKELGVKFNPASNQFEPIDITLA